LSAEAEFTNKPRATVRGAVDTVADSQVAISPIVLKALSKRDVLTQEEALGKLDELAEQRSWLGAPLYRRATNLFE